jgi:aminocarboxymuconate-semialdehyde decarboxylase
MAVRNTGGPPEREPEHGPHRTVDVHAHALIGPVEALVAGEPGLARHREIELRRTGADSQAESAAMVRERLGQLTDVARRLADMTAAGVDVQVVSPVPMHYHYWAGPELAAEVCRVANDGIAELVAAAPDRLTGLGLVPLSHPDLAVAALEHAVLSAGLAGVEMSSYAPRAGGGTVELSDPALDPLWTRAAELGAVIFLHPFGCPLEARLDRWYLSNVVGQPIENAIALSHLIFGGVLDRHPSLTVIAAHGGGYLPTYVGRADHAWHARTDTRGCARPPSDYLRHLYYDSLVHSPAGLRALVATVGADRVLTGSDYPFDMGTPDPLGALTAAALPPADHHAIATANATHLRLTPGIPRHAGP